MEEKEIRVDLPGIDRPAVVVIARAGQVHPAVGDEVRVRWQLWLPAYNEQQFLRFELCFLNRVDPVCGAYLSSFWGDEFLSRPGYVGRDGYFAARKWAEAWRLAEEYVLGELQKLVDALEARQRALREAEEE